MTSDDDIRRKACLNGLKNLVHIHGCPLPDPRPMGIRMALAGCLSVIAYRDQMKGEEYAILMDYLSESSDEEMISILEDT